MGQTKKIIQTWKKQHGANFLSLPAFPFYWITFWLLAPSIFALVIPKKAKILQKIRILLPDFTISLVLLHFLRRDSYLTTYHVTWCKVGHSHFQDLRDIRQKQSLFLLVTIMHIPGPQSFKCIQVLQFSKEDLASPKGQSTQKYTVSGVVKKTYHIQSWTLFTGVVL